MSDDLQRLARAIQLLPATVTARLRAVAWRTSRTVMADGKANLRRQVHGHGRDALRTVDAIVVIERPEQKEFLVTVDNPENPDLGNWLEYGTVKMEARPYLRPAAATAEATYMREMTAAATDAVTEALS